MIDTLPQVAAVEATEFSCLARAISPAVRRPAWCSCFKAIAWIPRLPRIQRTTSVTWLGPDGIQGTADDREIAVGIGLAAGSKTVIYDPSSNVDVASGRTYSTAVRQTVTLLFGEPLPAGSYRIEVSPNVVSAPFNRRGAELALAEATGFTGHPVVSIGGTLLYEGAMRAADTHVDEGASLTSRESCPAARYSG